MRSLQFGLLLSALAGLCVADNASAQGVHLNLGGVHLDFGDPHGHRYYHDHHRGYHPDYPPYSRRSYWYYRSPSYDRYRDPWYDDEAYEPPIRLYSRSTPRHVVEEPEITPEQILAEMSWGELATSLREATQALDQQLERLRTGEGWQRYLQISRLAEHFESASDQTPNAEERQMLLAVVERFDATADNEEFAMIARLPGFRFIQAALTEYVQPAQARTRNQLTISYTNLTRRLDSMRNGQTWVQYLALPAGDAEQVEPDKWREALGRYEETAANESYRVISELREFVATRRRLTAYVATLDEVAPPRTAETD